jgi:hypothetical protein
LIQALEFFDHLRSDPKFKLASRDALTQGYPSLGEDQKLFESS